MIRFLLDLNSTRKRLFSESHGICEGVFRFKLIPGEVSSITGLRAQYPLFKRLKSNAGRTFHAGAPAAPTGWYAAGTSLAEYIAKANAHRRSLWVPGGCENFSLPVSSSPNRSMFSSFMNSLS